MTERGPFAPAALHGFGETESNTVQGQLATADADGRIAAKVEL